MAVLSPLRPWVLAPDIAAQIITQGADYVLCLKANHPTLKEEVKQTFEQAIADGFEQLEVDNDPPRVEAGHMKVLASVSASKQQFSC